jgi:hypothetical protein
MVRRTWTKPLIPIAQLILGGAIMLCCAQAQQTPVNGSLAGKLTDSRSSPLENMVVTLRNAITGAEMQTTTVHGGRYRFTGLAQGEYSLTASGPGGTGKVDGIFIAAGHESRVQTAIGLETYSAKSLPPHRENAPYPVKTPALDSNVALTHPIGSPAVLGEMAAPVPVPAPAPAPGPNPAPALDLVSAPVPAPDPAPDSGSLRPRDELPTAAITRFIPAESSPTELYAATIQPENLESIKASLLAAHALRPAHAAVLQSEPVAPSQSLDAGQLQALPLSGRNWQNFVSDATAPVDDQGGPSAATAIAPSLSVDGMRTGSAFGSASAHSGRNGAAALVDPSSTESAVRDVQSSALGGAASSHADPGRVLVETQRGSDHLHGQIFIFDRQNLWNAHNPFTQWVRETSPATATTTPAFTAEPYTPGNRETQWGAGVGGVLHKRHLFWFAALDGSERNDPGVATVKHPDNFFARPSNDQMQLLSAQLGLSSVDPVTEGLAAYSRLLETLSGLLGRAQRTSSQWIGFARIDGSVAERHHFTLEATDARLNSPGGGFSRAAERYGTHSFGNLHATNWRVLGRWEAFLTPNLLAVTQASYGQQIQTALPGTPSAFEQSLNINAWGRLPQIVVDSRYGFTIGNPARFGRGKYPDERLVFVQEQLNWVRGSLLFKAGAEISHNRDATSQLRNQTGTYHYSSIENFASDALAFSTYGISGQLDPMNQHNCDQTGRAWRDSAGVLHGLGYLPCYSYYSQTMGPADWWLSTNDWAAYLTSQWQPARQTAFTLAMRWELEQLPPPILNLHNPDLPLTAHTPSLGNQWGPRAGFAWGTGESHWPVLRLAYGLYFSRTRNSVLENVLTQTGSLKGDLNFFMRPTDNLNAGGAPPFPYVLAGEPASIVKPGAVEFAPNFRNGEVQQAEASVEESLPGRIHLEAAAVASLGRRLPITIDANIDPYENSKTITYAVIDGNASGPIKSPQITVPFFASWPSSASPTGFSGRINPSYQQVSEIFSRANSTYEAATLRVSRNARALTLRARYTFAHAADWNPDETSQVTGPSVLDPIDFRQEYGTSALDVRHSATAAVIIQSPWKLKNLAGYIANGWMLSSTAYFRSGMPYTMRTTGSMAKEFNSSGTAIVALANGMNGYGGDNRVYGVGRNTYRYPSTWKADMRLGKRFNLGPMRQLEFMAESFNLFNHQNVTELETAGYSIESGTATGGLPRLSFLTGLKTKQAEFGKPLNINATNFYRERQIQFGARLRF